MLKPKYGRDFLVDWYAILRVARDVNGEMIRLAHQRIAKGNLPHRYDHLAEEFQQDMERRDELLEQALRVLGTPERRRAYDELLASWPPETLSGNGKPIVDLSQPRFNLREFLATDFDEQQASKVEQYAMAETGLDLAVFATVERMYEQCGETDEEVATAYRRQLAVGYSMHVLRERVLWFLLGRTDAVITDSDPELLVAETGLMLQQHRGRLAASIGDKLYAADGTGSMDAFLKQFDAIASEISGNVADRALVMGQRLQVMRRFYAVPQAEHCDRLILRLRTTEKTAVIIATLLEGDIDIAMRPYDIGTWGDGGDSDLPTMRALAEDGTGVLTVEVDEDIPRIAALPFVLRWHFGALHERRLAAQREAELASEQWQAAIADVDAAVEAMLASDGVSAS